MNADQYLRRDSCPVCEEPTASSAFWVRSNPSAESLPLTEHGTFLSGYTTRRVFFTYHRCSKCGVLYCPTYFTQEQLDLLYGSQSENMAEVPLASRETTQRTYLEILARYTPPLGNYLELGPDIGLFAGYCGMRFSYSRLFLFEPNRTVHALLMERLDGHNANVCAERYARGMVPENSISTAVAIHVLDHLIDPAQLLNTLHNDMVPGGILFVVTHNEASLLARALGRRWPPYTLQHPLLFSPRSIVALLERHGFEVLSIVKTRNHFPLTHLVRAGFTIAGLEHWTPAVGDGRLGVSLALGNIATVARKPV